MREGGGQPTYGREGGTVEGEVIQGMSGSPCCDGRHLHEGTLMYYLHHKHRREKIINKLWENV